MSAGVTRRCPVLTGWSDQRMSTITARGRSRDPPLQERMAGATNDVNDHGQIGASVSATHSTTLERPTMSNDHCLENSCLSNSPALE